MAVEQDAERARLAEIRELVRKGCLEETSGGVFGLGYTHCQACRTYVNIVCTDSPGDRLDESDLKTPVNCPNCSTYLGSFLSATHPVTLIVKKEEYDSWRSFFQDED